jgi:hypothetical protein
VSRKKTKLSKRERVTGCVPSDSYGVAVLQQTEESRHSCLPLLEAASNRRPLRSLCGGGRPRGRPATWHASTGWELPRGMPPLAGPGHVGAPEAATWLALDPPRGKPRKHRFGAHRFDPKFGSFDRSDKFVVSDDFKNRQLNAQT